MRLSLAVLLLAVTPTISLAQQGPTQVMTAPVERRAVELTQPLVANVMPVTRTTVAAEQEGLVEERMFDDGQRVERGAVLVRVNDDLLKIQRDAAAAARKTAEGELQQAKAQLENAQRESKRVTELFEARVATEKEYRDMMTMLDVTAASVATHTARVAERTAEVDRLETMLKKCQTYSPLDGVIARRHVEVGQWIERGAPVADLLQLDPLFVEVNVPEQVITRVRRGDPAQVQIDALGRKSFTGKIDQIVPQADAASRTFRVRILLPNSDLAIWPGFFARAVLTSGSGDQMFLVPRDAIVTRDGRHHVVAVRDGQAVIVPVELGSAQAEKMAVTGELSEGEPVVTRGNEALMPGMPVMVLPPAGATTSTN